MCKDFDFISGETLLIDKPTGWTSFDVVAKIRNLIRRHAGIGKIKVGHAGTLDPAATGLLIVCTGASTKLVDQYQASEKEYMGEFTLGATTPSFDAETETDKTYPIGHLTPELIIETAGKLTGQQMQEPPVYSALKYKGKRAYRYARKDENIRLQPREIEIREFEILSVCLPKVAFRVVCSKGTYIRALARDFGTALNSGAYLASLTRTRIGEFRLEDAVTPEQFEELLYSGK